MADTQEELQARTTDVTVEAFNAFAEDIATMFDTEINAIQMDISEGTVSDLKSSYKKLAAICSVKAEGVVNGEFHVVFDKDGVFTLPGTFVMQPEQIILQNRKKGSEDDAREIGDALGEVGNLLVGSWDRIFREELEGHGQFTQTGTYIGNPWTKPEEAIRLSKDEEIVIITFEVLWMRSKYCFVKFWCQESEVLFLRPGSWFISIIEFYSKGAFSMLAS